MQIKLSEADLNSSYSNPLTSEDIAHIKKWSTVKENKYLIKEYTLSIDTFGLRLLTDLSSYAIYFLMEKLEENSYTKGLKDGYIARVRESEVIIINKENAD